MSTAKKQRSNGRGNVRITEPLYSKLKTAAKREQRSMNSLATILIERGLAA